MQRWRRKTKVNTCACACAFAVLCSVLMLSSFLYNDGPAQMLPSTGSGSRSRGRHFDSVPLRPSFPTYFVSSPAAKIRLIGKAPALNGSDWSRSCLSTGTFQSTSRREVLGLEVGDRRARVAEGHCDLFSGKWVYDNKSYPLYDEGGCPYMSDQLACWKHGRPDLDYQRWRWQPHRCDLKRWNAIEMLEKLRNKRLMFVGDSLNRGQWISMVCMLQSVIPEGRKSMSPNSALTIFRAKDYNATVEFYWAPLLVESNSDDPVNHRLEHRIIRPDSIQKHASKWEGADILVFNTYLWWRSGSKIKLLWIGEEDSVCEEAEGMEGMKLALETWAKWVASYVDNQKKQVFYVTMSPTHLWSREWDAGSDGNCYHENAPIDVQGYWGSGSDIPTMRMVEGVLGRLSSKVSVLNITQLSEYRKDGHPSIYRKFWEKFSKKQLSKPASYADCIHWCLPGVPDTWNHLLFHHL